jgi:hypothetical protein
LSRLERSFPPYLLGRSKKDMDARDNPRIKSGEGHDGESQSISSERARDGMVVLSADKYIGDGQISL